MKNVGYPDKPVENASEDLFNVEVYVNALCSFIRSCDTPMTVSIQGDWGSGKTSMMNMMRTNMQGAVWSVWFNTWQFSQFDMGNSLAFSMMDVLLKGLDCDKEIRKKILNGIAGFSRKAVKVFADTAFGGEVAGIADSIMNNDTTDYASEIVELKAKFQNAVNDKLQKENRNRVIVFVDDLDRLQPSKAVELLEVLKLFLDCEKCVFVLAVDYEVVTLGIKQKFGDDVSEEKGRSFFDKIIQLPFKMPVSNYDIHKYVKGMMQRINISTEDTEVALYYSLIQTSIGFNPRSMKRLFNTFELLDIVTESTVKHIDDLVRRRVLFAIICAQMCFEKLYLYFASTRIDEDTFGTLRDESTIEDALMEIYGLSQSDKANAEIEKLKKFMPHFVDALQIDDDEALSEDELNNLRIILKCSVVTSVNASSEEDGADSMEWEYRNKNKELVKTVIGKLESIGKFVPWMPRKARDGVKFSDISGWYAWDTGIGFDCSLEYYLSRINDFTIGVSVMLTLDNCKGMEKTFFEIMGNDPLQLNVTPQTEEYGRYRYNNVLRVNANDESASDQIAAVTRNAYVAVKSIITEYRNGQS